MAKPRVCRRPGSARTRWVIGWIGLIRLNRAMESADMATTDPSQYGLVVLAGTQWRTGSCADYAEAAG